MSRIIEIEEDKKEQNRNYNWNELMTDEQRSRGEYYCDQYHIRRGEIDDEYKQEFDDLCDLYECKRVLPDDSDPNAPCNFIPVVTPTVEGQVASMMESDIDISHVSNNPAHKVYIPQLDAASEYYRTKTQYKAHTKDLARYYDLLGTSYVEIEWDDMYKRGKNSPKGIPRITVPPILSVLVDGRIKNSKDFQYSEYIILEKGFQSISWARKKYGDKVADGLLVGYNRYQGNDYSESIDDTKTFMLLRIWTRDNEYGNLQKIEMDANGFIFYESDPSEPYYKFVDNEYPIGIVRMIPRIGKIYGIGDGAILKPIQEAVNNLTDELELAARFSAQAQTFVDPDSKMDGDQITSNPADIIWCKDPQHNIFKSQGAGVNTVVFNMIQFLLAEAQKATRFHESMTGNQGSVSATATQINTQQAQGYVGIKDKKSDLAELMAWADTYALKLCIEKWDKPFWAAISDNLSEYVDTEELMNVPMSVPLKAETLNNARINMRNNNNVMPPLPTYESATDSKGNEIMGELEFSTKVIIGESIPKGKTDMYNILLGLAQMNTIDENGMSKPLITPARLREIMEQVLGFKLRTDEEMKNAVNSTEQMDMQSMQKINPVGQGSAVQTPTNLQQTVPQMPNADSRKVQI